VSNFGGPHAEHQGRRDRHRRALEAISKEARVRLRWNDVSQRRRTVISLMGYATLGGLACAIIFLGRGRTADAWAFAGISVVVAVATAALHVVSLKLRHRHHGFLYGVAAIGGTVAFAIVAITARSTSDVASALALAPPMVGGWFAVHWVSRLSAGGLQGPISQRPRPPSVGLPPSGAWSSCWWLRARPSPRWVTTHRSFRR
jgi:hypothetical protein